MDIRLETAGDVVGVLSAVVAAARLSHAVSLLLEDLLGVLFGFLRGVCRVVSGCGGRWDEMRWELTWVAEIGLVAADDVSWVRHVDVWFE